MVLPGEPEHDGEVDGAPEQEGCDEDEDDHQAVPGESPDDEDKDS